MTTRTPAELATRNRTAVGVLLIGLGVVLALDSAGMLRTTSVFRWWPLVLVGVGIVKLRQPREDGQRAAGVAFLLLGGLFLFTTLLAFGFGWPLVMIGFGGFLLWQGIEGPRQAVAAESEAPYVSDMALIGFLKRAHRTADFRGGALTAVMGGIELDLRKAAMPAGPAYLDVVAIWGGIEIKVPPGWAVDARVVPVMGAFENKAESATVPGGPRLVVRGQAIMGGVVVSS